MSTRYISLHEKLNREIEQAEIAIRRQQHGFTILNQDIVSQHPLFIFCHQGSCRLMYDMREMTYGKNDYVIIMPGHVLNQLSCTDDFVISYMMVSADLFKEIHAHVVGDDTSQFIQRPIVRMTDERVGILMKIADMLEYIASFDAKDMFLRHQLLRAQLFVGSELIYHQYCEQEQMKGLNPHTSLYYHFCYLVVKYYRESREVKFYADLLHVTPKHFTRVIRQEVGISPVQWIEQYVVTQAKRLIEIYPNRTLGQVAYMLGFTEPTTFYRYFKRVTGTTAKQYRENLLGE